MRLKFNQGGGVDRVNSFYSPHIIQPPPIFLGEDMTLEEILDRIQNVLYQDVDTESQDLDLLRHDLELAIIEKEKNE